MLPNSIGVRAALNMVVIALIALTITPATAGGAAVGTTDRYVDMPEPVAAEAPATLTGATVRLLGRQRLYRIDATGNVTASRYVRTRTSVTFGSSAEPQTFAGKQYLRLTSGRFTGWWVGAPSLQPQGIANTSGQSVVRLDGGTQLGVRFYANGTVRLRHAVNVAEPTTFSASQRASFGGRQFVLLASGPLAGQWVSARRLTVVSGSVADGPQPTSPPTAPADSTAAATWKGVVLLYPGMDVTYTRTDGTSYHMDVKMGSEMHDLVTGTIGAFKRSIREWSGGLARLDLDIVDVPHALTSLDRLNNGSYWVGPRSVEADIDRYAPAGKYDSVFVIWKARDQNERIPVGGWGLTLPPGSWANGAGYSSIITPSEMWWWTNSAAPEEVFVHEWMHQVLFWQEQHNRLTLDLHAGARYGYEQHNGTWKRWISHVMQGKVWDGGHFTGVSRKMWEADQPTRP